MTLRGHAPENPDDLAAQIYSVAAGLPQCDNSVKVAVEREIDAKSALDHERALLESCEAAITDEALCVDGLTNDQKRKAAVNGALRQSEPYQTQLANVRNATNKARKTEADHQGAKDLRTSCGRQLDALGKMADLMSAKLYLQAQKTAVEAAQTRLKGMPR